MRIIFSFLLMLSLGLLLACGTSKMAPTDKTALVEGTDSPVVEEFQKKKRRENVALEVNSLEEYLRRIPGLQVSSNGVSVRGSNSSLQNEQPLFVVDGVRIGHSLSQASQVVDAKQIDKVTVLKDISDTSFYGTAGSNGVIVIKMKKG